MPRRLWKARWPRAVPKAQTKFFTSSEQAADFLSGFVKAGDLLLVKGSRGVKMERVVESLLARYAADSPAREKVSH